jgi:energy-coupling factor transporter ATP-binding protein EcfA2
MTGDQFEKAQRYTKLSGVFTPGAPVVSRDRFAGRVDQVLAVLSAIMQPGMHVVLYGERGVGKTSLANVLSEFLIPLQGATDVARINCTTGDKFTTIWSKIYRELDIERPEAWSYATPDPDDIRRDLSMLTRPAVVILDEHDRVEDDDGLSLLADAIKALSDHGVASKLVVVGVADSIDQLVGEHESVQRALIEVQMPRMSQAELTSIIDAGLSAVGMTIEERAKRIVGRLAEGLPFFVHQLMLTAAQRAVMDDRSRVSVRDVEAAIDAAVKRHTLLREYQTAVQSPRPDNLYSRVLVACALADKNPLGFFTASAVREPMSRIMGKPYDIPAFARHLNAFTEENRGAVLIRGGSARRYIYRFRNPLLQPFALLTAMAGEDLTRVLPRGAAGWGS